MMSKFKVGDKVKLLPSIVLRSILGSEIGKIGIITGIPYSGSYIVKTDSYLGWYVQEVDIIPAIVKGQQLLFSFMSEQE